MKPWITYLAMIWTFKFQALLKPFIGKKLSIIYAEALLQNDLIYNSLSKNLRSFELPPFNPILAKIFIKKRIKIPGQSQCSSGSNLRTGLEFFVNESCVPLQFRLAVPSSVPVCNSTVEMNEKYSSVILNSKDQSK